MALGHACDLEVTHTARGQVVADSSNSTAFPSRIRICPSVFIIYF